MAWTVDYDATARRQLRKLPKSVGERILEALDRLAREENPRQRGIAMAGRYAGYWRYRIGDYRAIARIVDQKMLIVVIEVGHRREVYR